MVRWSAGVAVGGGRQCEKAPTEPEVPTAGDLTLDRLVRISALLLIGCVALGKSLNLSELPFRAEVMMVATFLGF